MGKFTVKDFYFGVAAGAGNLETVKLLSTDKEVDIHSCDEYALIAASWGGHLEIVEFLVEAGADVNAGENGSASLRFAKLFGHSEVAEYLVSKGAEK